MKQTKEELWAVAAEFYKLKSEGKNPIVQYLDRNNRWDDYNDCDSLNLIPTFNDGDIWRLKPETTQHRGGEYPKPCTDADEILKAKVVYMPYFMIVRDGVIGAVSKPVKFDVDIAQAMADSGLYYLKSDDALARAKVIYEID